MELDFLKQKENHDFKKELLEYILNLKEKNFTDTFRTECRFCELFVHGEMVDDFFLVIHDYIENFNPKPQYEIIKFVDDTPTATFPLVSIVYKFVNIFMTMAKHQEEYAIKTFTNLYKIYYKKEYQTLKRFRTLSVENVLDIASDENFFTDIARILIMAPMLDIQLNETCFILFRMINDYEEDGEKKFKLNKDEIHKASQQILYEVLTGNAINQKYEEGICFLRNTFMDNGYINNFDNFCHKENYPTEKCVVYTYAILSKIFPDKSFPTNEIAIYSVLYYCISLFSGQLEFINQIFDDILGLDKERLNDSLKNAKIKFAKPKTQTNITYESKKTPETQNNTEELIKELKITREKLHHLEYENQKLSSLYEESKNKNFISEEKDKQYQTEHEELMRLREYVYRLSEEDIELQSIKEEDMISYLYNKKIIIIGGHSNWTYKLKNMFKNWSFINPKVASNVDENMLNNADYIYFFTDIITHSTYYRFVNIARNRNKNFGFIHTINIHKNIKQIYEELIDQDKK